MKNKNKVGLTELLREKPQAADETALFLLLSEFNARSHVLHFIKMLENCRHITGLAEKHSVIWISSPMYERGCRYAMVFFKD